VFVIHLFISSFILFIIIILYMIYIYDILFYDINYLPNISFDITHPRSKTMDDIEHVVLR